MAIDYLSLGLRIKNARIKRGMTQDELAAEIGVSRNFISMIEKANSGIKLETLIKIANVLEASLDELLLDSLDFRQDDEFEYILLDCSKEEEDIIIHTTKYMREILRKYKIKNK